MGATEAAAVKRVVDGIMQPYLAQGQRRARGRTWTRSPDLGAIVAVSLHGRRYFFPYGKATNAGAPFARDTLVEIGSCTKTFTTTLFRWPSTATKSSLMLLLRSICPKATRSGRDS
jgi:CubicO group peptidase (beta-lactamase class C family)